jgi:plastocyanin
MTVLVPVAIAAIAAVAGCGRSSPDLANGKRLFTGKATCGSCHTLSRANTHGTTGPNLDDAFSAARQEGFGKDVVEGIVLHQILYPRKGSTMPAKLVTGTNARDVAAYVAAVAAVPGQDTGVLAEVGVPNNTNKTAVEQAGKLSIPADPTGALAFAFGKATASAGSVTIQMPNPSPVSHNIAIQTGNCGGSCSGAAAAGSIVAHGGTSSFTFSLKPGTYTFYCQVPGHAAAGMHGVLTVK